MAVFQLHLMQEEAKAETTLYADLSLQGKGRQGIRYPAALKQNARKNPIQTRHQRCPFLILGFREPHLALPSQEHVRHLEDHTPL